VPETERRIRRAAREEMPELRTAVEGGEALTEDRRTGLLQALRRALGQEALHVGDA
jgi:hypothetical protein